MKNHSVYIKILTNAKFLIITCQTTTLENKKKILITSKLNDYFLAYFRFFVYLYM